MPRKIRIYKKSSNQLNVEILETDGESMNVPNREGVHKMYRQSRLVEKFDFVESTKL